MLLEEFKPLEMNADITLIDDMIIIRFDTGVLLHIGGKIDGQSFADRINMNGEHESLDFSEDTTLSEMIRRSFEWGMLS